MAGRKVPEMAVVTISRQRECTRYCGTAHLDAVVTVSLTGPPGAEVPAASISRCDCAWSWGFREGMEARTRPRGGPGPQDRRPRQRRTRHQGHLCTEAAPCEVPAGRCWPRAKERPRETQPADPWVLDVPTLGPEAGRARPMAEPCGLGPGVAAPAGRCRRGTSRDLSTVQT